MPKATVLVTGATGQQGGAVVRHLLGTGFNIRTFVRNPESAASRALTQQGIEVVPGDFSQPESLRRAMNGVTGVFSVQPFLRGKSRLEIQWGKDVANAAAAAGVSHFIYTSVLGADIAHDVPHFTSKAEVEAHIQSTGMPATILQPAGFMENLLIPIVLKGIRKGKLTTPNNVDSPLAMIAVDDIGAIAAQAFAKPEEYIGRKIPLVGEVLSTREQAGVLARVMGRPMKTGKLPGIVIRIFLGRDLYQMFRWTDENGTAAPFSIDGLRAEYPNLTTFEGWCREHFDAAPFGDGSGSEQ